DPLVKVDRAFGGLCRKIWCDIANANRHKLTSFKFGWERNKWRDSRVVLPATTAKMIAGSLLFRKMFHRNVGIIDDEKLFVKSEDSAPPCLTKVPMPLYGAPRKADRGDLRRIAPR